MDLAGRFANSSPSRLRVLIGIGVVLLILLSWTGAIDRLSTDYVDGALLQASVAFAVARSLNAVISVLQSIDVQMVVVGFSPGEMLDPFNDMVEQFGTLMQYALGSLILQKILLVLVSDLFFRILLTVVGGLLIVSLFTHRVYLTAVLLKTFLFMAFLRFALVLMVVLSSWVDHAFLEQQLRRDVTVLERLPASIDIMNQQTDAGVPSLGAMRDSGMAQLDARQKELRAEEASIEAGLRAQARKKQAADSALASLEATLSATARFNFLSRDDAHQAAIDRVDQVDARLAELERQRQVLAFSRQRVEKERSALNEAREENGGFWSSLGGGISSLAGKVSSLGDPGTYSELMDILNNMTTTIVTVMTLFVLKTMIMPLAFLYLFLQVFRKIWGVDLPGLQPPSKRPTAATPG